MQNSNQHSSVYRTLGKTGYNIFPVAYGGIVSMRDGQNASDTYVSWAVEQGINYFDVAPTYEDAQEKLGKSLRQYRNNIFLACKTMKRTFGDAERELNESLKLLHTDYFDVYQLHALSSQNDIDQAFASNGVMELLMKAQRDGRIRKIGITAHSEEVALKAISLFDFDTVMFPMNWLMNMHSRMGSEMCTQARQRTMGILSIKSFAHRAWKSSLEKEQSSFPKSWVKPIALEDEKLAVAALKYSFFMGADAIIPSGDFQHFAFTVRHIHEIISAPLTGDEKELLQKEYSAAKEFPFF